MCRGLSGWQDHAYSVMNGNELCFSYNTRGNAIPDRYRMIVRIDVTKKAASACFADAYHNQGMKGKIVTPHDASRWDKPREQLPDSYAGAVTGFPATRVI